MIPLISVNNIAKTMGSKELFDGLSFGIHERERIGLIGPNGSGKSTLLKMLARKEEPDEGEINQQKNIVVSYVSQDSTFPKDMPINEVVKQHLLDKSKIPAIEAEVQAAIYLSLVGFEDIEVLTSTLSGGWLKRLAIATALAEEPDLLILDEPTNHMDWQGILWLEDWLKSYKKSFVIVSHDRVFLNKLTNRTIEINKLYRNGFLSFDCNYVNFLGRKDEYIQAQMKLQESLSNKARREVEWMRAGVKARTTKSQSRMKDAHALLETLDSVKDRNRSAKMKSRVEIDSTARRTKKLIEFKGVDVFYDDNVLIKDLSLSLGPKTCVGLLGHNGSGKTSLLKAITGENKSFSGEIVKAEKLEVVYFDQKREALPQDINLVSYLGDGADHTMFKGESIHVASYASRFLFSSDKMNLKISQLSGGEQARLLIAKLLLRPADVLILDEPTNDLDIDTIEILEQSLRSFDGLVMLVSHDRQFLSELCQKFIALEGNGNWQVYAEVEQWLRSKAAGSVDKTVDKTVDNKANEAVTTKQSDRPKVKLSYKEKRQLETIEQDIQKAEADLTSAHSDLQNSGNTSDHEGLKEFSQKAEQAQGRVDKLYALWEKLEKKRALQ